MKNLFNKVALEKLGIFELRNLAREIGVYSPTIYKKQEIIKKILAIINGEEKPHVSKTKQGRPPKTISGVNNLLDIFIPKTIEANSDSNDDLFNSNLAFKEVSNLTAKENNFNLNYSVDNDFNSKNIVKKGILKIFRDGYGFCFVKGQESNFKCENLFISSSLIKKYNLKTGDELEGYIKNVADDKPMVMYLIKAINGELSEKFNITRKDFNSSIAIHPNKKIIENWNHSVTSRYLNKFAPFGMGQRVLFVIPRKIDCFTLMINYLNKVKRIGSMDEISALLINERPEDVTEYRDNLLGIKVVSTTFENNSNQSVQKVELEVERLKRQVEKGKNVMLAISNINRLKKIYKEADYIKNGISSQESNAKSEMLVQKLITSARNTKNMGTFTIISVIENNENDFIINLKQICNSQLYINTFDIKDSNKIFYDILKTKTRKLDKLISEKDYDFTVNFMRNVNKSNMEEKTIELENIIAKELKNK